MDDDALTTAFKKHFERRKALIPVLLNYVELEAGLTAKALEIIQGKGFTADQAFVLVRHYLNLHNGE